MAVQQLLCTALLASFLFLHAHATVPTVSGVSGGPFAWNGAAASPTSGTGYNVTGTNFTSKVSCYYFGVSQPSWNWTLDAMSVDKNGTWAVCPAPDLGNGYSLPLGLSVANAGSNTWVNVTGSPNMFTPVDLRSASARCYFDPAASQVAGFVGYQMKGVSNLTYMQIDQTGPVVTFTVNWQNVTVPDFNWTNGSNFVFHVHVSGALSSTCGNSEGHFAVNGITPVPQNGVITVSGANNLIASVSTQTVTLGSGPFNIIGRSIVMHYPNTTIVACCKIFSTQNVAPTTVPPTVYEDCTFGTGSNVTGSLLFHQDGIAATVMAGSLHNIPNYNSSLPITATVNEGTTCIAPGNRYAPYAGQQFTLDTTNPIIQLTGAQTVVNRTLVVFHGSQQVGCCPLRAVDGPPNSPDAGSRVGAAIWGLLVVVAAVFAIVA